jgi:hypothetical protein
MMECIKTPVFDLAGTVDVFISRQVRYQHCGDENECAPSFAPPLHRARGRSRMGAYDLTLHFNAGSPGLSFLHDCMPD